MASITSHPLNKNRVNVGAVPHLLSEVSNLKKTEFCVDHTLNTDQYGRSVGEYGVKRFQPGCSQLDSNQTLEGVMNMESKHRREFNIYSQGQDTLGVARDKLGFVKSKPIANVVAAPSTQYQKPGSNLAFVPERYQEGKPLYNHIF